MGDNPRVFLENLVEVAGLSPTLPQGVDAGRLLRRTFHRASPDAQVAESGYSSAGTGPRFEMPAMISNALTARSC